MFSRLYKTIMAMLGIFVLVVLGAFGAVSANAADGVPDPVPAIVAVDASSSQSDAAVTTTTDAPASAATEKASDPAPAASPDPDPIPSAEPQAKVASGDPTSSPNPPPTDSSSQAKIASSPYDKVCSLGESSAITWTKNADLSMVTATLKSQYTSCDIALHAFGTEGKTWETSGTQTFVDFAGATLTKSSPTLTLTVTPKGCYQQQDFTVGSLTKYDGKDGALPHYPDSSTPNGLVDHWNGAANCAPPTATLCTTKGTFLVTNVNEQGFNYSPTGTPYADTRANGHYEYVSGALHVYTDDNSTLAKLQAARAVSIPVKNYGGSFSLDQTLTTGTIKVAINVRFTDGAQTFTATAEPGVPGYNQLWSNASGWLPLTATGGDNHGQGGPYSGTIDDIVASHPNATVTVEALTDGSGVYNDALVTKWSTPCNTYTYNHVTPTTPVSGTPTITVVGPTCKALYNTISYNVPDGLSVNGFKGIGSIRAEDYPNARGDGSSIYGHWTVPVTVEDGFSYNGPSTLEFDLVNPASIDCTVPTVTPAAVSKTDVCGVDKDKVNIPGATPDGEPVVLPADKDGNVVTLSAFTSDKGGYSVVDTATKDGSHSSLVVFLPNVGTTIAAPVAGVDTYTIEKEGSVTFAQWKFDFTNEACPSTTTTSDTDSKSGTLAYTGTDITIAATLVILFIAGGLFLFFKGRQNLRRRNSAEA